MQYVRYGVIVKDYRNANMIYTPSEMVGTKRTGIRGIGPRQERSITTSHVERLNGTQRLFLKRLNRLTYCFSKKLRNLKSLLRCLPATTIGAGRLGSRGPAASYGQPLR